MKKGIDEQETQLRHYLLGELSSDEQQLIEERLLVDEAFMEQMLIVEEDLIDDYVEGLLSPQQQANYQKLFLASLEGRQRLQLSRILKRHLKDFVDVATPQPTFWERFQIGVAHLFSPTALKIVAALLFVSFGVFSWWVFLRSDLSTAITALKSAYSEQRPLEFRITGFAYARFYASPPPPNQISTDKLKAADTAFHNLLDDKQTAASLHELGKYNLSRRNFDEAVKLLTKGLALEPNNTLIQIDLAIALIERGRLSLDSGQSEQAQADFQNGRINLEQAIASSPTSLEAHFNLALFHQTLKNWSEAEKAWRHYLTLDQISEWSQEARHFLEVAETQK